MILTILFKKEPACQNLLLQALFDDRYVVGEKIAVLLATWLVQRRMLMLLLFCMFMELWELKIEELLGSKWF